MLQNIQNRYEVVEKFTLNQTLDWGQKLWEQNQSNMIELIVREKRTTGELRKQVETWGKALKNADVASRASLLANSINWKAFDSTILNRQIGGKKPEDIPKSHWQLLHVMVEIIPTKVFNKIAVEVGVKIQLSPQVVDVKFPYVGYIHPRSLEKLYKLCKLGDILDGILTNNSWNFVERFNIEIEEDEKYVVNELHNRVPLGNIQG